MGVKINYSDYRRLSRYLTHPASLISVDRYTRVWERQLLGQPIQFIQRYTDPKSLLVIVGERILKKFLGAL